MRSRHLQSEASTRTRGRPEAPPALLSGLQSARRWGGTSAGFSGGRALGHLYQRDDVQCAVLGACFAGVAGAASVQQIPTRVFAFAALTCALDALQKRLATLEDRESKRHREVGPGLVEKSRANPYGIPVLPPDEAQEKVWREVSELYPWLRWIAARVGQSAPPPG